MNPHEVHVWRVPLAAECRDVRPQLRAILRRFTNADLELAVGPTGKPWLPAAPSVKFNLSHSRGMALVGVALEVEVGVDVERYRPLPEHQDIAARFFPPSEAAAHRGEDEREFFRRWTRIEAMLKALGVGLLGAGQEIAGEWTVREIDAGADFAAAAAAARAGMTVTVHDLGGDG